MKTIPLTQGRFAQVDDEDYERIAAHKWCVSAGYAMRRTPAVAGQRGCMVMHRQVLGLTADNPVEVDHINGDRLDNRKSNLRLCNRAQNSANTRLRSTNTSGYKGVTLRKTTGRWQASIQKDGKSVHLGFFTTAEQAHAAYCQAAAQLFGEFSNKGA